MRTILSSSFVICGILVLGVLLATFPTSAAADENLVENGDFSRGLDGWTVSGGPGNTCQPSNPDEPGGYYSCAMVTDRGNPENPHLELYVGTGGEFGSEKFEPGVGRTLTRLPRDAGSITTLSLRAWSLANGSYVRTLIITDTELENATRLEDLYDAHRDWYESYYYPSREPTTITRDITNFHDPTTYLIVAGDRVAVDDITIVATAPSSEPLFMQQIDLIKNGDFSQSLKYWEEDPLFCCGKISEEGSPGNLHLELLRRPQVSQQVYLPEGASRVSVSIKAWALTLPGQNPENVIPNVEVRIIRDGSIFDGTVSQETFWFLKPALRTEPAITMSRDLTGFKGKNITLMISGEEAAVDDVSVLARWSSGFPTTVFPTLPVVAVILAASVVPLLALRRLNRTRSH